MAATRPVTSHVIALSGSPSSVSKTGALTDHVLALLDRDGIAGRHLRVSGLDPAAILRMDTEQPAVATETAEIEQADGVIVATPIYKASFAGILKAFLDVLPQYALAGKVVLPIGTGGSPAHILALDYGLRPVLQSMGARHIVQAVFVASAEIQVNGGNVAVAPASELLPSEAILHFRHSLKSIGLPSLLGHPRPERAA